MNLKSILFYLLFSNHFLFAQNDCYEIDLTKAKQENIKMSSVFDKIEYIPLETTPDCLLKPRTRFYVTDKYIVAINVFDKTFLFDRKTGRFIHEIGREGQGPDEYKGFMLHFNPLDEKNEIIYAYDVTQYKGYDLKTGRLKTIVKVPLSKPELTVASLWSLGDGRYITTIPNYTGHEDIGLKVFDKNGHVSETYPNTLFYDPTHFKRDERPDAGFTLFYNLKGRLYMSPTFLRDTVYLVANQRLIPHFVISVGNKPFGKSEEKNSINNKKILHLVRETDRFVFFTYGIGHYALELYSGYYDKSTQKTYISSEQKHDENYGFFNDIDGFPSFTPLHINERQEVIGRIIPADIYEYVKHNELSSLSPRAKDLIKDMQEDDNPIVIIAQPKK